jgi:hypothetical protein
MSVEKHPGLSYKNQLYIKMLHGDIGYRFPRIFLTRHKSACTRLDRVRLCATVIKSLLRPSEGRIGWNVLTPFRKVDFDDAVRRGRCHAIRIRIIWES